MKLRKWVKVVLTLIIAFISLNVYAKTGYNSEPIQVIYWLWLIVGQFTIYGIIWN